MHLDVRIIAATNENLETLVEEQKYLRDLFFRLAVVQFELPPLRERPEDIPLLADYFVEQYSRKHRKMIVGFEKNALDFLLTRKWPGNVREMENAIESAVIFSTGRYLSAKDFQWSEGRILLIRGVRSGAPLQHSGMEVCYNGPLAGERRNFKGDAARRPEG